MPVGVQYRHAGELAEHTFGAEERTESRVKGHPKKVLVTSFNTAHLKVLVLVAMPRRS